ncbi:uncharacterized protein LOC129592450 isoform X2 [Paramacrobiotus metropolitanus]|uniref:uncharacterized protein LOC129592450 isoform X2 n=1 Tax=Paramacrobiotus metropolitanus TaxID=2943436 RepID=UPI0024463D02|nr:uncharacterized protein LOC129592450 isoform X2 [Paramacrobiotus metropolitanus]
MKKACSSYARSQPLSVSQNGAAENAANLREVTVEWYPQLQHGWEDFRKYAPEIRWRRLIALLGLTEVLLVFIMFAIQMCGCDWPYCDVSFHMRFAVATYIVSLLAGSTAFLVAGEHLKPKSRFRLKIFGIIIILVNLGQTVMLGILKTRNVIMGINISNPRNDPSATTLTTDEIRLLDGLKNSLIAMVVTSGVLLLTLALLLLVNALRHHARHTKCAVIERRYEKVPGHTSPSGREYSYADIQEIRKLTRLESNAAQLLTGPGP